MIERAERVVLDRVQTWGSGDFMSYVSMDDTGGSDRFETVAEATASLQHSRHQLVNVGVYVHEIKGERSAYVGIHNVDAQRYTPKWVTVSADGPDEAAVVGLVNVTIEEVKAARREAASIQGRAWMTVANHPWTVGVGTALVAAAIIAGVSRLLG